MMKYLILFLSLNCILTGCDTDMSKIEPKGDGWGYAKCYDARTKKLTWEGDYIKHPDNSFNTEPTKFYTQHGLLTLESHYCIYIEKELEQPDAN